MLPSAHRDRYAALLAVLEPLRARIASESGEFARDSSDGSRDTPTRASTDLPDLARAESPDDPLAPVAIARWRTALQPATAAVLELTDAGIDPEMQSRWRSLHTEIHRSARLLQTALTVLAAARQPATRQQRGREVCDRLDGQLALVRAVLELGSPADSDSAGAATDRSSAETP